LSILDDNCPVYKKSQAEMEEILPLLRNNFLTKNLNDSELSKLASAMKPETYKKGQVIIKYGDFG